MTEKKELNTEEICANVAKLLGLDDEAEIAEWFGVLPNNIQRWKKRGFIPESRLRMIAATRGVRREWLKFGEKPEWEEHVEVRRGYYKLDADQFNASQKIAESRAYRDFIKASLRLSDENLNILTPVIKAIRQYNVIF